MYVNRKQNNDAERNRTRGCLQIPFPSRHFDFWAALTSYFRHFFVLWLPDEEAEKENVFIWAETALILATQTGIFFLWRLANGPGAHLYDVGFEPVSQKFTFCTAASSIQSVGLHGASCKDEDEYYAPPESLSLHAYIYKLKSAVAFEPEGCCFFSTPLATSLIFSNWKLIMPCPGPYTPTYTYHTTSGLSNSNEIVKILMARRGLEGSLAVMVSRFASTPWDKIAMVIPCRELEWETRSIALQLENESGFWIWCFIFIAKYISRVYMPIRNACASVRVSIAHQGEFLDMLSHRDNVEDPRTLQHQFQATSLLTTILRFSTDFEFAKYTI